jgi:hypothetical protein
MPGGFPIAPWTPLAAEEESLIQDFDVRGFPILHGLLRLDIEKKKRDNLYAVMEGEVQ